MKPSWDDAPSWAQWLAMDGDGTWFWFEEQPYFLAVEGEWVCDAGNFSWTPKGPATNPEDTLERRP